jgi:hypothetical protein
MTDRHLPSLSLAARELLASERLRPAEDEALKRRVLERARDVLSSDRSSGVALRAAGSWAWRPTRLAQRRVPLLAAAALAFSGLAVGAASAYRSSMPATAAGQPSAPRPQSILPAQGAPAVGAVATPSTAVALAATPAVEPSPPVFPEKHSAHAAAATDVTPSGVAQQQYALELAVLEPARRAISQRDYLTALAAIARHQRDFPQGELSEERDALRVRALWGAGQKASADRAALDFRKRYPKSGLLSWKVEPGPTPAGTR